MYLAVLRLLRICCHTSFISLVYDVKKRVILYFQLQLEVNETTQTNDITQEYYYIG